MLLTKQDCAEPRRTPELMMVNDMRTAIRLCEHRQMQDEPMASSPLPGRTPHTVNRASISRPQLRVRWDRVSVLVALVAVLATVVAHTVVVAVRDGLKTPDAKPPLIETAAATPAAASTAPAAAPAQPLCPRPAPGVIRTAPVIHGQAGEPERTVALTFDDGPGPATPEVLNVLHQNGVPATFFVVGQRAAAEPEMLQRIVADGHALGDHTWSHPIPSAKAGWKTGALTKEIEHTRRAIVNATGREPCLFRPPGGIIKGAQRVAHAAALSMILWSVDTRDWAAPASQKFAPIIQKRAAAGLKQPHPVILLHDGGGNRVATVAALAGIINDYRSHGYRFVTLDEPR
jgi:peptidoglycan-N-acetylglucosamine deacetylase